MKRIKSFTDFVIISGIILLLINSFTSCTRVNSAFYDKILSDFDTSSYFIALDIKSSAYKGRVIIENNNLYNYLNETKGLNKEKYQLFMKRILTRRKVLKVAGKDFIKWKFIKVTELGSVIRNANSGENSFIAHYFNGRALNYGIQLKEQNAIINQLFYWYIPSKIDKNTGSLIIG